MIYKSLQGSIVLSGYTATGSGHPTAKNLIDKELQMTKKKESIAKLLIQAAEEWRSPFIARRDVPKFTGGMISANTLRNRDSQGTGPDGKFQLGKKVGYPVDSLINWLVSNYTGEHC